MNLERVQCHLCRIFPNNQYFKQTTYRSTLTKGVGEKSSHFWKFMTPTVLNGLEWINFCLIAEMLKYFFIYTESIGKFDFKNFMVSKCPRKAEETWSNARDQMTDKLREQNDKENKVFHLWEISYRMHVYWYGTEYLQYLFQNLFPL